ncbi:unannotated protein [freshwater metagenome]|uniref:Unannotated protein n=1 Tax=freshwater metagenome TaxID=449393 RepID=A0A6J6BC27_9ZZZZ
MTSKPKTPAETVSATAITKPKIIAVLCSRWPTLTKTVPVARVASETRTVSHPTKMRYESAPGMRFPLTPKVARERTIVGAFDFFPASELTPTSRNERTVPRMAAMVACQKEIPKPKKNDPYESAKSETFAPHHGQKREDALPARSLS